MQVQKSIGELITSPIIRERFANEISVWLTGEVKPRLRFWSLITVPLNTTRLESTGKEQKWAYLLLTVGEVRRRADTIKVMGSLNIRYIQPSMETEGEEWWIINVIHVWIWSVWYEWSTFRDRGSIMRPVEEQRGWNADLACADASVVAAHALRSIRWRCVASAVVVVAALFGPAKFLSQRLHLLQSHQLLRFIWVLFNWTVSLDEFAVFGFNRLIKQIYWLSEFLSVGSSLLSIFRWKLYVRLVSTI